MCVSVCLFHDSKFVENIGAKIQLFIIVKVSHHATSWFNSSTEMYHILIRNRCHPHWRFDLDRHFGLLKAFSKWWCWNSYKDFFVIFFVSNIELSHWIWFHFCTNIHSNFLFENNASKRFATSWFQFHILIILSFTWHENKIRLFKQTFRYVVYLSKLRTPDIDLYW